VGGKREIEVDIENGPRKKRERKKGERS